MIIRLLFAGSIDTYRKSSMDFVPTNKMNDMFDNVVVCTISDFDSFEPNKYRI